MPELDELFRTELNAHGFGFQHAVVQMIHRHRDNMWEAAATEFPVAYRDRSTHVDVLAWCFQRKALMVAECKRVNPAFGNWVFARSPFTFERDQQETWLEQLVPPDSTISVPRILPIPFRVDPFHIAVEVKTNKDGDQAGLPKGRALSQSLTQVAEGVNGLIEMLPKQKNLLRANGPIIFLPVIFTTANLYATDDAELHLAELDTGHMPEAKFEKKSWLWFESNVSPDLLAEVQHQGFQSATQFQELLPTKHTRAIAIVSHDGVASFLRAVPNLIHQLIRG